MSSQSQPTEDLEKFVKDKINEFTTHLETSPEFKDAVKTHLARMNIGAIVRKVCEDMVLDMATTGVKTLDYDAKTKKAYAAVVEKTLDAKPLVPVS